MIFVALNEAAERGELLIVEGGLCRFHLRRDGVVVIREILVLPDRRGQGIGRRLVEAIRRQHPDATLRAACPADYEANGFWAHLGFTADAECGANRVWEFRPSSIAPTATVSSLASP